MLHDEERRAVLLADVVERADVRMIERRNRLGLALESLAKVASCASVTGSTLIATVRPSRVSRAR
jgi:hypothetical protein